VNFLSEVEPLFEPKVDEARVGRGKAPVEALTAPSKLGKLNAAFQTWLGSLRIFSSTAETIS
jgi:hypothetical protein